MDGPWGDLDLEPPGEWRFRTQVSDAWHLAVASQGGIVAAIAATAMARVVDHPEQVLRTLSAVFAGQVACGPVEVEVATLRRGRSMSQCTATVRNVGAAAGLTAIAVFGARRRGFEFSGASYPTVEGPEGLRSFRDPLPDGVHAGVGRAPMPFWDHVVDCRYRLDDPPVDDDGRLDTGASIVLCDTMPGAVFQKVPPSDEPWFGPSVDLTVHVLDRAHPGWLLAHNRARHAGDGYASVDLALWDPTGPTLMAYATQVMFFVRGVSRTQLAGSPGCPARSGSSKTRL